MSVDVNTTSYSSNGFSNVAQTVSFPSSLGDIQTAGGALSYFYASYGDTDHHVKKLEAYVDDLKIDSDEIDVTVDLTAEMKDDSGHDASTTLNAGVAADQST